MSKFGPLCVEQFGICTARKRSLGQGYIFTGVCHSVNEGGSASVHAGIPPARENPLPRRHTCQEDTPFPSLPRRPPYQGDTPAKKTPPPPPCQGDPPTKDTPLPRRPLCKGDPPPRRPPCQGDPSPPAKEFSSCQGDPLC